ncbi:hypothetical protein FRAHR75_560037 [Frankia sp. Hr75.2]|nr:hypothetical protein FRAHR75_560037 [Frankia sp. Hr75.2]SQD99260.1 hypothetical protein FMEAI12_5170009 [Parafrankia sp. Ea1.12]
MSFADRTLAGLALADPSDTLPGDRQRLTKSKIIRQNPGVELVREHLEHQPWVSTSFDNSQNELP